MYNGNNNKQSKRTDGNSKDKREFERKSTKPGGSNNSGRKTGNYTHPGNDFSWWNKYPELIDAAARVSFPYKPGTSIKEAQRFSISTSTATKDEGYIPQSIPGICVIDWVPSVGHSSSVTDPISIVGKELFSRVRSKFSGTIAVDGPDMVMQIMATDSIFAYLSWLKRVYRCVNSISKQNFLFPERVLEAMGFDNDAITALKANRMQLYSNINLLIHYAQKIRCPKIFDVLQRHTWMSEYLYADAPTDMCQIYMFNPKSYYKFELVNTVNSEGEVDESVKAGGLTYRRILANELKGSDVVTKLFTIGNELLTALTEWEDMYLINGYFERAFEGVENYTISLLGESEVIATSYDEEVLSQIENACTVPHGFFGTNAIAGASIGDIVRQQPSTNAIWAKPTAVVFEEGFKIPGGTEDQYLMYGSFDRSFLSIRKDNPDIRDVVQATRLHCIYGSGEKATGMYGFEVYAGTEIVLNFHLYAVSEYKDARDGASFGSHIAMSTYWDNDTAMNVILPNVLNMASFDFHPIINSITLSYDSAADDFSVYNHAYHGDVHNLTVVDNEIMKQIHLNCLLSAFSVFSI